MLSEGNYAFKICKIKDFVPQNQTYGYLENFGKKGSDFGLIVVKGTIIRSFVIQLLVEAKIN